jgi:hypothetical protein
MFVNPLSYCRKNATPVEKRFCIYGFTLESDFGFQIRYDIQGSALIDNMYEAVEGVP